MEEWNKGETSPTASQEETPLSPDEQNVMGWAQRLGLDEKDLVQKFRDMAQDGNGDPIILNINTEKGVEGFLDKDKVQALLKKKHWSFFFAQYSPEDGKFYAGTFAGHVPTRGERKLMGIREAQKRTEIARENLDFETIALVQGETACETCLDHFPPWFSMSEDSTEVRLFYEVAREVRNRISSFR